MFVVYSRIVFFFKKSIDILVKHLLSIFCPLGSGVALPRLALPRLALPSTP